MTLNIEIRVQRKTAERIGLLLLLNSIREDIRDYDKKENEKKKTSNH